jgi:hypothetical protein
MKCLDLRVREDFLSDFFYLQTVSHELQVDSDLAAAGYHIKGHSVRVGDVEADLFRARFRDQGGLSVKAAS